MPRIAIATSNFDGIVSTFRDGFGMPVMDLSENSVPGLGAKLAMCVPPGGSNIELMCPAEPKAPLSQSLQRFLDRRGEGLFALMLEAPDPDAEAQEILARGLNVLPLMPGAGGRDIHPNSTHGVLIRVYPVNSFRGGPAEPQSATSGIVRVVIAVRDLDAAARVYGGGLGLATTEARIDESGGIRIVGCQPPSGGLIHLVSVEDDQRPAGAAIAEFLAAKGEGMYALVLQAPDPLALLAALAAKGIAAKPAPGHPGAIEISRGSAHGALIRVEPVGGVL